MSVPTHIIIKILIRFDMFLVIPSIRRTYSRGVIPLGRYYGVPILVLTNRTALGLTKRLLFNYLREEFTTRRTDGMFTDFLALSEFIYFSKCHYSFIIVCEYSVWCSVLVCCNPENLFCESVTTTP